MSALASALVINATLDVLSRARGQHLTVPQNTTFVHVFPSVDVATGLMLSVVDPSATDNWLHERNVLGAATSLWRPAPATACTALLIVGEASGAYGTGVTTVANSEHNVLAAKHESGIAAVTLFNINV